MSEDRLARAAAEGVRARELLQHDLLAGVHQKLEDQLIEAWIATPARDTEGRERCWAAVQANRKHKRYFETIVINGKLAEAELRQLAEATERKKRFGII